MVVDQVPRCRLSRFKRPDGEELLVHDGIDAAGLIGDQEITERQNATQRPRLSSSTT